MCGERDEKRRPKELLAWEKKKSKQESWSERKSNEGKEC